MTAPERIPSDREDELEWIDLAEEDEPAEDPSPAESGRDARKRRSTGSRRRRRPSTERPKSEDAADKPAEAATPRPRKMPLWKRALRLILKVAAIAAAGWLLTNVIGGVFIAHDNNMYPAVRDGDLCITYRLGGYYNGDVVAFERDGQVTFGRVFAVPGDVVEFTENGYSLNGTTPYEVTFYQTKPQGGGVTYPYTVQEGEWFILCDQREDAQDSRTFGAITKPLGKVVLQIRRRGF